MAKKYRFLDDEDVKRGECSSVRVRVFNGDFLSSRTHYPPGTPYKDYTGYAYTFNKREELMTILSPKGKGYRVIQAKPENVTLCKLKASVPFKAGEYVV